MREILFRGKDLNNRWYEGVPMKNAGIWTMPNSAGVPTAYVFDPNTLCQYTGLNNHNGTKIFENDIISFMDAGNHIYYGTICFGKYYQTVNDDQQGGHIGFYVEWQEGLPCSLLRKDLGYWYDKVEIVGNIFDNLDLVKKGGMNNVNDR